MASLIFGLDTDTEEVFDLCYEFLTKSQTAFFQACPLTPYPGTPVFEQMKAEGRILTDDWSKFDSTKVIISPKNITTEQLHQGYNDINDSIYSNKSILQRALPNVSLGFIQALLYVSLNKGFRATNNKKIKSFVHRNPDGVDVDFNVKKYVMPVKKAPVKKHVFVY